MQRIVPTLASVALLPPRILMNDSRGMIFQKRQCGIKPSDIMQVSQPLTQGFILDRPSDQNPVLPSFMPSKHINREDRLDLMGRTKVVGVVVDVNDDESTLAPYIDCEEKYARVVGPVWKNFAYDIICAGAVILRVQCCRFHFDDGSLCGIIVEDIVAYVSGDLLPWIIMVVFAGY